MFDGVRRTIKLLLITVITVGFLMFSVVNREVVSLSFFPLPYSADLPKFLLAIACFSLGAIVGGMVVSLKTSKAKRQYKAEHKRVIALENEVATLHVEERDKLPAVPIKL